MKIISDVKEMQKYCRNARSLGRVIAFVPTMGYLHNGHLSLVQEGRKRGDLLVLSIFVNPAQFGPNEDLAQYPRNVERDQSLARGAKVDCLFLPSSEEIYPKDYSTFVSVEGNLTSILEGASRSGHFRGVTTVVCKLFNIVQPDFAIFGQKDFQQLAVVKRMTSDLNLPVEIIGMPIVRESDGLAMSSRNVYLSEDEREQALILFDILRQSRQLVQNGQRNAQVIMKMAMDQLNSNPKVKVDYVKICHSGSLEEAELVDHESVMLLAIRVGKTRLIDNSMLLE